MSIVSKLTLRHLFENRKRTIVTILGIAMSTALISSILLGVFSFFKFFGYISTQTDGNVHAAFYELTDEQVRALKYDDRISAAGLTNSDPTISGVRLIGGGGADPIADPSHNRAELNAAPAQNRAQQGDGSADDVGKDDRLRIGNIAHGDPEFYSMMVLCDYDGTLPANSSEIAVEEQFLAENGLDLHVGDTLSFEQGNRYSIDPDGEKTYWAGNYRSEEAFETLSNENCTVTAILHHNRPTSGYDILRGMDPGELPAQKYTEVRISLANCNHTAIKQLKQIANDYGIRKCDPNTEYMLSVFAFEGSSGAYRSFFVLMAIALIVVVVTSVVLIVNSLGMSLAERMRYLGMLASVGATAVQKRSSIYFEGFILGLIGIPAGILIGFIGTKATLSIMGSRILEAEIIAGAEGMRGSVPIVCPPWIICVIAVLSGITIFIAAFVPALRASKVMPIDALRQNHTIKVRAGRLRVHPLVRKVFGYEGELAYKNIKRNGLKGAVITVSITVSVILFLTIRFFCDSVTRANQYDLDLPFQVVASCSYTESGKLRDALTRMDGVDRVFSGGTIEFVFENKTDQKITPANKDIADPKYLTSDYAKLDVDSMALVLIDDGDFRELLRTNGLSEDKYFSGTLRGVLLNNYFHESRAGDVFNDGILGQSLHYDEGTSGDTEDQIGFPPAVEIGDFVRYDKDNYIFNMTPKGTITVYAPASVYYEKAKEKIPEDVLTYDLCVVTSDHKEVCRKIYEMMEAEEYHNYNCEDMANMLAVMQTVTMMLQTAMYGFTVLLTLIAVANIVNTISTGVLLRRKEFAMYKSVGMASGGFRKMIRLETFLYGIRALLIGLPVSLLVSYLMYRAFDEKIYAFDPDWLMYAAVTAAVFAVVGISMLLSVNKIKDDSIIEALKEDAV